jgi:hypothetical protein
MREIVKGSFGSPRRKSICVDGNLYRGGAGELGSGTRLERECIGWIARSNQETNPGGLQIHNNNVGNHWVWSKMNSPVICHSLEWCGMHRDRPWPPKEIKRRQPDTNGANNYHKYNGQFSSLIFSHSAEL